MEKKKYAMAVAEPKTNQFDLPDGAKMTVVNFIPYAEKENFVMDVVAATLQIDEEQGICYRGYNHDAAYLYCFLKYYTDVDVEGAEIQEVFDWLTSWCDVDDIYKLAENDLGIVFEMEYDFYNACRKRFEQEHSLGQMAKALFNTDVDTNNAETRELIEKLVDMKGALMEKEDNEKILQFGQKKTAKSVKTGGAMINLAKKT